MTQFKDVLETILEEYARRNSEGEFDTWEETDAFVNEKAEVLLAYVKEEPVSEELEKEIRKYLVEYKGYPHVMDEAEKEMVKIARHFANWQKQQLMKDAVEGEVCDGYKYLPYAAIIINKNNIKPLKTGDKIKLIIVKED